MNAPYKIEKKIIITHHAQQRYKERFHKELTQDIVREFMIRIVNKQAKFCFKEKVMEDVDMYSYNLIMDNIPVNLRFKLNKKLNKIIILTLINKE